MLQQVRAGSGRLDHRPVGRQIATENGNSGAGLEWLSKRVDHVAVPAGSIHNVVPDGLSIRGQRTPVQQTGFAQFAQHGRQAPGVEKVFHEMLSRRLNIHQARQAGAEPVEIIKT